MKEDGNSVKTSTQTQVFWLAGAVATAAAAASWAYSRKKTSRFDRARGSLRPWLNLLASAAGLLSAARNRKLEQAKTVGLSLADYVR